MSDSVYRYPYRRPPQRSGWVPPISLVSAEFYRSLTIDHNLVPNTDQTNFPALVSLTHVDFKSVSNGGHVASNSGFDILFFSDVALTSQLSHEIERYDPATGEVVVWVKVPTVFHAVDTTFYIKYGDASITSSQEDSNGVWSNGFAAVLHLDNGTTLNAFNSVSEVSGTVNGPTASSGQVDGAANFASLTDHILTDLGTNAAQRTYTVWAKREGEGGGGHGRIFIKGTTVSRDGLYVESVLEADTYNFVSSHNGTIGEWTFPKPSIDVFHYIVVQYDNSSLINDPVVYVDKIQQTVTRQVAPTGSPDTASEVYVIGNRATNLDRNWDGDIDEFHIADAIRLSDWHDTEYNNQTDPGAFVTPSIEVNVGEFLLAPGNTSHAHSAQNLTLTQAHSLAVQNASHTHTADNLALTQVHSLVVQNASHEQTSDNAVLTQVHSLAIQNATHSHTAENLVLATAGDLIVQNSIHAHSADSLTLTQVHNLSIANASHAHTAEGLALTQDHQLVTANASHAHTSQNVVLTQVHGLTVQSASHGHTAENLTLAAEGDLGIQNASHGHTAQNLALTQVHQLVIANSSHAHSAENAALTQVHVLAVQNAAHSHSAGSLTLTQVHSLAIQNATHGHTAENLVLAAEGTLGIQNSSHAHTAQSLSLTQAHTLTIANSSHGHTAQNLTLTEVYNLTVQSSSHAHSAGNIALTQVHDLTISNASHGHVAQNVTLGNENNLLISNSIHAHTTSGISFNWVVPGDVYTVGTENTIFTVVEQSQIYEPQ